LALRRAAERLLRAGLHALPAEPAHDLALRLLPFVPPRASTADPRLRTTLCGLDLPHPIGLAAGFDKDAVAVDGLLRCGFAFVETGTVTRHAQPGNPRPRLFRLEEDRAIVNRMGFNNAGLDACLRRMARRRTTGTVGANIGLNKDAAAPLDDYAFCLGRVLEVADYVTVNVSSPNTPGLRALQQAQSLRPLLERLVRTRDAAEERKPLLLKAAPDLADDELDALTDLSIEHGLDALILTNTTTTRPAHLRSAARHETGGLSGAPLAPLALRTLRRVAARAAGRIELVGVGGIMNAADAYARIRAGAAALQIYTSFVYGGPAQIDAMLEGLGRALERDGFARLADAVGADLH